MSGAKCPYCDCIDCDCIENIDYDFDGLYTMHELSGYQCPNCGNTFTNDECWTAAKKYIEIDGVRIVLVVDLIGTEGLVNWNKKVGVIVKIRALFGGILHGYN